MFKKRPLKPRKRGLLHLIPFKYELALGIGAFIFLIFGMMLFWFATTPIPDINDFETRRVPQSTKIYDRTGTVLLYDVHGSIRRTTIQLEGISPLIQKAVISIEDPTFYTHKGISPKAIVRAVIADIMALNFAQGGSTITQQVVKNTILTSEKTITRKIKEWVLAIKLEQTYGKDQILTVYLNETPYGGTIYGIEEASQYFFGKPALEVTLAEAAYLAAMPQAPTYYSPHGNHRDALDARKNSVIRKMFENGFISADERDDAMEDVVDFVQEASVGIKAPHFVFYVQEYLEQKYGADAVNKDGLRVITTLDYDLQKKAEDVVSDHAEYNEKNFNASNAAVVAINPNTGEVVTMVGSRGYFDENIDGKYNVAIANRQPGSSFKPFVYAAAFEKGYRPETVLFNLKTQFTASCSPDTLEMSDECYSPDNYDGKFTGPMSLKDALAQSMNVPAVKLLYLVGITDAITMAERLGITTLNTAAQYGLTLVLGGGEVQLLDMVSAYGGFATDGVRHEPTVIIRVEDSKGKLLEQYVDKSSRVLDEQTARQISNILSDNVARTPEFGSDSALNFPGFDVADKTGTTNDSRDAWIVGYTPSIVVGAWAGNNDNSPMVKKIAGFIVAPMWHDFMEMAMEKYPAGKFIQPDSISNNVPPIIGGDWNIPANDGRIHSILHWVNKRNPLDKSVPTNPETDSQYALWEYPIQVWSLMSGNSSSTISSNRPFFIINSPTSNLNIPQNSPVTTNIQKTDSSVTISNVAYYLDGFFIGSVANSPFSITFTPTEKGVHTLTVHAQGSSGTNAQTVQFTVK